MEYWSQRRPSMTPKALLHGASRKGRQDKENKKLEARNPKYETNYNDGNTNVQNSWLNSLEFWSFEFWYCFGFRYSKLGFNSLRSLRRSLYWQRKGSGQAWREKLRWSRSVEHFIGKNLNAFSTQLSASAESQVLTAECYFLKMRPLVKRERLNPQLHAAAGLRSFTAA